MPQITTWSYPDFLQTTYNLYSSSVEYKMFYVESKIINLRSLQEKDDVMNIRINELSHFHYRYYRIIISKYLTKTTIRLCVCAVDRRIILTPQHDMR